MPVGMCVCAEKVVYVCVCVCVGIERQCVYVQ